VVQVPAAATRSGKAPRRAGFDTVAGAGTENSFGYTVDFNWAYDNRIIKGWTVLPGVTWFQASRRHADAHANYLEGAKSMNIYFLFNQNAPTRGRRAQLHELLGRGERPPSQPLGDRDFVGGFITRNF